MEWSATLAQAVRAHGGEVASLDASGARLATAGGDRALRLWRWRPGDGWQAAAEARAAHRYGVPAVRWARAGALLASGGVDGAVRVWCGRTLAPRRRLAAPGAAAVRALCWPGGGARLVAGHDDGAVRVWCAARGALVALVAAHEAALHALAAPARAALLLTACSDGVLKVYDLAAVCAAGEGGGGAPAPLQCVTGAHDLGALCADASEAGVAATGGHDARIRVWRPAGGPLLQDAGALEGHAAAVTALRWAGDLLASASLDRTARLWAPAARACLLVVPAHARYLTCVALAPDLRYMITGSNDRSFRMWSLGSFSIDDELEPPCAALEHFALGDLEGIGPVEETEEGAADAGPAEESGEGGAGATRVWSARAHTGAINCIATWDSSLATASSDGTVKVWRWEEGALRQVHELRAHRYPALAADLGAGGALLLTGGLDGCAFLWDVQAGVVLRSLVVPSGGGGEAGGGGVRGARISPHRPPLLLLATDDGLAPLWRLADPDPHPAHVYAGHAEAVTCCAWSADGRLAATGAASGELRVLAPPPRPACLHHDSHAHDLGVLSCDFAPPTEGVALAEGGYLLATGGSDSFVKLWRIDLQEDSARVEMLRAVPAHGGAVAGVRWGAGVLASAGEDRWARVWRVQLGAGGVAVAQEGAAPARGAGGALAAALLAPAAGAPLLAVGSLGGELALWRLPAAPCGPDADDGSDTVLWGPAGVLRWLRDYIVDPPGSSVTAAEGAALEGRVRGAGLTGARLLTDPVDDLLELLGFEAEGETRRRARRELRWLRAAPPSPSAERAAPHALLCPMSHRLLRSPARAADGYTYERASLLEWLRAAPPGGAASPVSGRRLRTTRVAPNYLVRDALREYLRRADGDDAAPETSAADDDTAPGTSAAGDDTAPGTSAAGDDTAPGTSAAGDDTAPGTSAAGEEPPDE